MSWLITPQYLGAAVSDADAQAYLRAVETADNQGPLEQGVQQAVNQFVIGCKADGIWTAIKASCILAGARTLAGALVPLVGTAPTNVDGLFISGDYNRKTGLVGDGSTKYLNSNRNNNADPQNSKHISCFISTANTSDISRGYIGAGTAGDTGASQIFTSTATSNLGARINAGTTVIGPSITATGFAGAQRSASTVSMFRASSTNYNSSVASQTPLNETISIFGRGGLAQTNGRLAFYSIGESLDLALLDTRVTALINAFDAAI
jgi:hypothetical protein